MRLAVTTWNINSVRLRLGHVRRFLAEARPDVRFVPRRTAVEPGPHAVTLSGGEVARGGVEPPTFRFSVGRSYQLSYLAVG